MTTRTKAPAAGRKERHPGRTAVLVDPTADPPGTEWTGPPVADTPDQPSPTDTTYRAAWSLVTVRGHLASHGIFYRGQHLQPWDTANGEPDTITPDEIDRLLALGAIEPVHR